MTTRLTAVQEHKRHIAGYIMIYLARGEKGKVHNIRYAVVSMLPTSINKVISKAYAKRIGKDVDEVLALMVAKGQLHYNNGAYSVTDLGLKSLKAYKAVMDFRRHQNSHHNAMIEIMEWCAGMEHTKAMIDESIEMFKPEQRLLLHQAFEILERSGILEVDESGWYKTSWIAEEVYKYMIPPEDVVQFVQL